MKKEMNHKKENFNYKRITQLKLNLIYFHDFLIFFYCFMIGSGMREVGNGHKI